jgi:hypothetical protein
MSSDLHTRLNNQPDGQDLPMAQLQEENQSSLNSNEGAAPSLYQAIASHRLNGNNWRYAAAIKELHRWKGILCAEFHLDLPEVAFCIGYTRIRCHGYYRPGHNWYGFQREILLKDQHVLKSIEEDDFRNVIVTEGHELLHAWQDKHGRPGVGNYHNAQFRQKASGCGLIVDSRGHTKLETNGRLVRLFEQYGIAKIPMPEGMRTMTAPTKLHKWVCSCHPQYGVRVAIENFSATCHRCGEKFLRVDCQQVGGDALSANRER